MPLARASLSELEIEDEASFRHVGLYGALKDVVLRMGPTFLVPEGAEWLGWDRASLLNLLYWQPGTSDVLCSRSIAADVVMHVAWHELARQRLESSTSAHLLGESIASAFDLYLVGRLLGHSPNAGFLESQVPRMADAATEAGVSEDAFQKILTDAANEPERAFESLRQLLFDASRRLAGVTTQEEGLRELETLDAHPHASLLHHYELATWVLRARLEGGARVDARPNDASDAPSAKVDRALRASEDPVSWLERSWVGT